MNQTITKHIAESIEVKKIILNDEKIIQKIQDLANNCLITLKAGGKIIFAGNGGSFADAQHLSAEFTSRFLFDRAPLASIALGTNSSAMSAIGNDYGYQFVFSRELSIIAQAKDIFIPISTSGNSPNILSAVKVANNRKINTVGLTGQSGGELSKICNCICVPSKETARIQESHILIGHIICALVEKEYFQ